jgi:hypothetical protein
MSAIRFHLVLASIALTASLSSKAIAAGPIISWLCGCSSNMSSETTYAPAYVPTPVAVDSASCNCGQQQSTYYAPSAVAPVPVTSYYAPIVYPVSTTAYYAPAAVAPAPVTVYRPLLPISPRPTSTYAGYNPYSAAPVTVYRPIVGVAAPSVLPYTSYRMVYPAATTYYYAPPVSYYSAPAACPVYSEPVPSSNIESPSVVPGGSMLETPSLPQNQPSNSDYVPAQPNPSADNSTTDNYRAEKPVTSPQPKPAPTDEKAKDPGPDLNQQSPKNQPKAQENSLPRSGSTENPDRTTMRPIRQVTFEKPIPQRHTAEVISADVWRPSKD